MPVQRAAKDTPPPESLKEAGAAEWAHALSVCPWIALSDLTVLSLLCEAIDERAALKAEVTDQNVMMYTSNGYAYVNPAIAAMRKTEEQITKWMQQLGMTPSARGALGVAEVKAASTLDALAERRRTRPGGHPASSPASPKTPSTTETGTTSSSSSTPTEGSPKTASRARRAPRFALEPGSETSSGRPSPETP